ncbi:MAG: aminopeptidase N [Kineosporiaceae bacterium]
MPGTELTREETTVRAGLLEVADYDIRLDLTVGASRFATTTVVRFDCRRPGEETFVDLIAPQVLEVVLNGTSLPVAEVVETGRIRLPGLAATNELRVVAEGAYMNTGEGLHRFEDPVDGNVYLYTQFEVADARRVFACFDQPDLKATFRWTVTAPSDWQVVSVSPTPQPTPVGDGVSTWSFDPTPRLSTYVTALVAGPYHVVRGSLTSSDGRTVPLGVFCRASLAEHLDADEVFDLTLRGFAWFERQFEQPYPFAKYDQLFVPEFNAGAMENAGAVTITEQYVWRSKPAEATVERRALTILHELAHMWFGDLVTMRWWDDLWLNESFAEYISTRCQAEATRWGTAWTTFSSAEKSWAYRQDQLATTHPIVADIETLADVEINFDGITYAKGASVLKQLVAWVGEEAFDEGLRRYFRTHAWGNTTLADLLAKLRETSGRDVDAWAKDWLQTAGVATLRPVIEVDAEGVITSLAVTQEAPPEQPTLRPHRLAVGGYDLLDGALRRVWRHELDIAGARTDVPELAGRPRPDLLLVNDDDLAYAKIRLDPASLSTAVEHLGDFEDSLPRTLIWGAAWDMTRDAELGARAFVRLVSGHVATVDDPSVAQTLLRQLGGALAFYAAPEFRAEAEAETADRLIELLRGAEPGSDTQLLLLRSVTGLARTPDQLDLLAGLLDGSAPLPELTVDADRRWELLTALVVGGRAGEAEIAAELARDDTASGRLRAAAARAAVPTPEAKAAAWQSIVGDDELPNAVQAAVISGFGQVPDRALLEPFVEPYFACLERIWTERTSEMATQVVVGLYPTLLAGPETVERTDAWLAAHPDDAALRRLVVEGKDGVLRSLRAYERDRADA